MTASPVCRDNKRYAFISETQEKITIRSFSRREQRFGLTELKAYLIYESPDFELVVDEQI